MGKARVSTDKRTGNLVVRAYGRKDPSTKKVYAPSKTLPADATQDEIDAAVEWVELRAGTAQKGGALYTVGSLVDYYVDGLADYGKSPTTVAAYRSLARCYVHPHIGDVPFEKARQADFASLYRLLLHEGGRGGKPLSAQTVKKFHAFLSGCFSSLMKDGVTDRNPVLGVKVPKGRSPEAKPLSKRDFGALVGWMQEVLAEPVEDAAGWHRRSFATALWTCLNTGVRRGELAGFQAGDWRPPGRVEPDDPATLRVARSLVDIRGVGLSYKDPKSERSKRTLSLDGGLAQILPAHLAMQRAVLAEHGVRMGPETPLFAHADGRPIGPGEYTDGFRELARELDMERGAHLHTLRHTHASYLLEAGEHIKAIQERLGHSTIDITLNIYGHLMPGRDAKAAQRFGEVFDSVAQRTHSEDRGMYAPKCPLSGDTCVRFAGKAGTGNA